MRHAIVRNACTAYVDKHDVALKALEEAETQCQPFRSFLTNIYALNTVRSQTLRSFLIMPGTLLAADDTHSWHTPRLPHTHSATSAPVSTVVEGAAETDP